MVAGAFEGSEVAADTRELLETVYRLFNARDIDGVFAHMSPDVDWPNVMEGVRVHGYEAIRAYWTHQWSVVDPRVEPMGFTQLEDGRIAIDVHQVVKDLEGKDLADQRVVHIYTIENAETGTSGESGTDGGGLIRKMEVGEGYSFPVRS